MQKAALGKTAWVLNGSRQQQWWTPTTCWIALAEAQAAGQEKQLFLFIQHCETASGTECPILVSLLQNRHWQTGKNSAEKTKMMQGLQHISYKKRLGELTLSSLKKRRLITGFNWTKPWATCTNFKVVPTFSRRLDQITSKVPLPLKLFYSFNGFFFTCVYHRAFTCKVSFGNNYSDFVQHFQMQ